MKKLMVSLTPAESKRLISKGLLTTDSIQRALKEGYLCIPMGTTPAYLVEEILGEYDKTKHIAGVIVKKGPWVTQRDKRAFDAIFHKGEYLGGKKIVDVIDKMGPGDVIVKSANAIDVNGVPVVLLASPTGGTVGSFIGAASSKNIMVITPCGLEKTIPVAYADFAGIFGKDDWDYPMGLGVGAIALTEAIVFTEVDAFEALFNVMAIPIAAGGVNGGEGSVTFFVLGAEENIDQVHEFLKGLKEEPHFPDIDILV